jgi:hypothetical protein
VTVTDSVTVAPSARGPRGHENSPLAVEVAELLQALNEHDFESAPGVQRLARDPDSDSQPGPSVGP